jgi:hypothetical protein
MKVWSGALQSQVNDELFEIVQYIGMLVNPSILSLLEPW